MSIGLIVRLVKDTPEDYVTKLKELLSDDVMLCVVNDSFGSVVESFNYCAQECISKGCTELVFLQSYAEITNPKVISDLINSPGKLSLVSEHPNLLEDYLFRISSDAFKPFDSLFSTYLYLYDFFISNYKMLGVNVIPSYNYDGVIVNYNLLPIKANFEYFFSNDEEYFAVKYGVRLSFAGSLLVGDAE